MTQTFAEPSEIILSDSTTKALRGEFTVSQHRIVDLKGLGPTPVARLASAQGKNHFLVTNANSASNADAGEIARLSQY